jgi:hypothetical protein
MDSPEISLLICGQLEAHSGSLRVKLTWQFGDVAFLGHVELATWQHGLLQHGQCGLCYLVKNALGQAIQVNLTQILTNYKNSNVVDLASWQSGNWKRVK